MTTRSSGHNQRRRDNAQASSAKDANERHTREKTEINWDTAIPRFKAMLDEIDRKHATRA